jgi:AraC-like DNA-binding protein
MIDESLRTIKCAREIIETNLSETIPIGDICKNCAVSCSKLERIFRRELAMTPTQYILVRRLEAVNRVLAKPLSTHDSIGRIAMDFGFNHLGRFAGAYRSHFGELPSQTVRSS